MAVCVSSAFDSGSIEAVDTSSAADVQLRLVPEPLCELEGARFMQWFHFKVSNVKGIDCRFRILNAGDVSFASGWEGYEAVCTYDRLSHFRVEGTSWDATSGELSIELTPTHDTLWLSYFAPFTTERHMEMVTRIGASATASLRVLGQSLDGRDIECLTMGSGSVVVWIIAQQHPGEHMAEFWAEGLLDRLVDRSDAVGRALCDACTFHVVPRINPDGCVRGHLRTNAAGANLNREWCPSTTHEGKPYDAPSLARSPEVWHVLAEMRRTGCDCAIDVHGDEGLPYNFFASGEGVDGWTPRLAQLYERFRQCYADVSPDFQTTYGYERSPDMAEPSVPAPGSAMPPR
jgi:murein tripeptide amidase MpaA